MRDVRLHKHAGERPANQINHFGEELILDIKGCDISTFNRASLKKFFVELCYLIDMDREDLHFWDYEGDEEGYEAAPVHLKGTSAIQFIKTSNITVHTLDVMRTIYLNIFSCKSFNKDTVREFTEAFFDGKVTNEVFVRRS
jgi:S-adenosylmethionine/arginine decarboxylase-like enzyme